MDKITIWPFTNKYRCFH